MKFPTLKKSEKPGAFDELIAAGKKERRKTVSEGSLQPGTRGVTFGEPQPHEGNHGHPPPPPAYGEDGSSQLALPINRLSESSRSDGSSSEHAVYAQTTTTTVQTQTTTTFFRLPRRKKPGPLFPLPPKVVHNDPAHEMPAADKFGSVASRRSVESAAQLQTLRARQTGEAANLRTPAAPPSGGSGNAMARAAMLFATPGTPLIRADSTASVASNKSSPARAKLGLRGRSSTVTSLRNPIVDDARETPPLPSSRTSTSTARKSFGDLFSLPARLRADPTPSGQSSPMFGPSKTDSMQIAREPIVVPERHQDDSPAKYLQRLEEAVSRGVVASVLSKGSDTFSQQVLRSYMRSFGFFGDPMDMALRKLLMEAELPKETQHIDRCVQAFADRYHECNPGIYANPEQAYFIAFSLLILHTDVFNKNNKYKMQKADYVKNTRGEGTFDEILECFYDNISYTPFIHVEDDLDINGERIVQHRTKKKSLFPRPGLDPSKRASKEPVDPYTLIIDSKLDTLRPNLKEVMEVEEHYNYIGTAKELNLEDLQKTFFRTGILQIISARSRPDAFMSDRTVENPQDARPGVVDIKITKVGLLWRKDPKRKKTRSPWQEWGAILTGAQLYFFRNTTWIKSLIHQHDDHIKKGNDGIPVIFKPPIDSFKPDALMSTDDAVALLDSTYKKHKNAFLFVRHGGFEETFLADDEAEMNDWLAKLNYAAAFRTAGVRMRGVVGGNYDGQKTRGIRRLGSADSNTIAHPSGDVHIMRGQIDAQMAQDILVARRQIMLSKIADQEAKLVAQTKQLDAMLRNARHLQILAPTHPKTRENVVLAAGRMSAKLKWSRMEMWRLKCHRDILTMDLEEENKHTPQLKLEPVLTSAATHTVTSPTAEQSETIAKVESRKSPSATPHLRPQTPPDRRPSIHTLNTATTAADIVDSHISPGMESVSSFHRQQAAWELPPFDYHGGLQKQVSTSSKPSAMSGQGPTSPVLSHMSSFPSMRHDRLMSQGDGHRAVSNPQEDVNEHHVLHQEGLLDATRTGVKTEANNIEELADKPIDHLEGPATAAADDNGKEKEGGKEKKEDDRGKKIRRSIHRTLRDAHVPVQRGSKKGRDSTSGKCRDSLSEENHLGKDDQLSRGTGSFVVHGKKASVITFGDALSGMGPEERLRAIKPHQPSAQFRGPSRDGPSERHVGEDFVFPIKEGEEGRERLESTASTNTATAKSFRELHKRLSVHAKQGSGDAADSSLLGGSSVIELDSDAAVSFSDGRRTPLPPTVDEEGEGGDEKHLQAHFFTPDPSVPATPIRGRSIEEVPEEAVEEEEEETVPATPHNIVAAELQSATAEEVVERVVANAFDPLKESRSV